MPLNVKSNSIIEKLNHLDQTGEFKKYPTKLLGCTATVKVNADAYLLEDEFIVVSPYCNLPRNIYIYGKKTKSDFEDYIFFNYWMNVFLKTIEHGYIEQDNFRKEYIKE